MPQSDGRNQLKRFEFEVGGRSYRFSLNPEEYSQDEPSRSTVIQTKGGAWIDDFGGGLEVIFMRGSTGMRNGYDRFIKLRNILRYYRDNTDPGNTPPEELKFHNYTDNESWIVHLDPSGFKLYRSKTSPLMYMYELRLICLRKASEPKNVERTEVIVDRNQFDRMNELGNMKNSVSGSSMSGTPSASGSGVARRRDLPTTPQVPNRLANAAANSFGLTALGVTAGNFQARAFMMQAYDPYDDIKPVADNRLSPIGMHYLTAILNDTYIPSGEFPPDTLGYLVFDEYIKYPFWTEISEIFITVMLDLHAITDAYFNNYELFKTRFGRVDAVRLIDNIRYIVDKLAAQDDIPDTYKTDVVHSITNTMRETEMILSRMRKDPNLFDIDISEEMQQLNDVRGQVQEVRY